MAEDFERRRWIAGIAGTLAVCLYLLFFRVHGIESNFPLLGEQVRDWSIALRNFADLPLVGPRSVTSGLDIGPVYYWCLWAGHVVLSPALGPLPHPAAGPLRCSKHWPPVSCCSRSRGGWDRGGWRRASSFSVLRLRLVPI